MTYSRL